MAPKILITNSTLEGSGGSTFDREASPSPEVTPARTAQRRFRRSSRSSTSLSRVSGLPGVKVAGIRQQKHVLPSLGGKEIKISQKVWGYRNKNDGSLEYLVTYDSGYTLVAALIDAEDMLWTFRGPESDCKNLKEVQSLGRSNIGAQLPECESVLALAWNSAGVFMLPDELKRWSSRRCSLRAAHNSPCLQKALDGLVAYVKWVDGTMSWESGVNLLKFVTVEQFLPKLPEIETKTRMRWDEIKKRL
ncbi:hypothetical protein M011DRAFT_463011 [Sporormia fimetaria CBS 119925]|uniref:Uncharacterized protein n=1 Tax=Sporormia fimetaria CBS 119925 TaxID=1340428 RepID=A0A6A6UVD8_9PLEO|nr:hypothetical protein M011DRAFT_463011 [Sporormia fimetaria CBS 119925]